MVTFQREEYASLVDEIKPLVEKDWRELAENQEEVPLNVNYAGYQVLEKLGMLRAFSARQAGKLVGYAVYFTRNHTHFSTTRFACADAIWLDPAYRAPRVGLKLLAFVEKTLKSELKAGEVLVMHTTTKLAAPALGRILGHLGHLPIEMGYSKLLRG